MPIYRYEVIRADGTEGDVFEIEHGMLETLDEHPVTGEKVRKVLLPPHLGSRYSERQEKRKMDNKNIERLGFTKYQKDKISGKYHKVVGKEGPQAF